MGTIKFTEDPEALAAIDVIVKRALNTMETPLDAPSYPEWEMRMDLSAAHASCPMDLWAFAAYDDANFAHDLFGIRRHMNRYTGILGDHFLPRCALIEHKSKEAVTISGVDDALRGRVIGFHGPDGDIIGKFDFNKTPATFTGDVDESARLFVDAVLRLWGAK